MLNRNFTTCELKAPLEFKSNRMKLTLPLKAESCECGPAKDQNKKKNKSKAEQKAQEYLEKYGGQINVPLKDLDTDGVMQKNNVYTKESHSSFESVSKTSSKKGVSYTDELSSSYGVTSSSYTERKSSGKK